MPSVRPVVGQPAAAATTMISLRPNRYHHQTKQVHQQVHIIPQQKQPYTHLGSTQQSQQLLQRQQQQVQMQMQMQQAQQFHQLQQQHQQGLSPQSQQLWQQLSGCGAAWAAQQNLQQHPHQHHQQQQGQLPEQQDLWQQQQQQHGHMQQQQPLRLQHHQQQQQQHTTAFGQPSRYSTCAKPGQHKHSRSKSLAQALFVSQAQARAMLVDYPALSNFNHGFLRQKLLELADLMQVDPQRLGPALVGAPKVLGYSVQAVQDRLMGLTWVQPDKEQLVQLVLEEPLLLTWSSEQLRSRLANMESLLGISSHSLALLLQQHPQLLPASSHLQRTLQLVQQLFLLAAASEKAGFGTGVLSSLLAAPQHSMAQHAGYDQDAQNSQQGQQGAAGAVAAAARQFVLKHPHVLLAEPEAIQAQVAAMQATSGLPAAQVAAMLISQPALLLDSPVVTQGSDCHRGGSMGTDLRSNRDRGLR